MSRGPGKVREIIPVNMPHPRTDYDVRAHEEFANVRGHLWHALRNDLIEQRAEEVS